MKLAAVFSGNGYRTSVFITFIMAFILFSNPFYGQSTVQQSLTVKGKVMNEKGALSKVNIYLKNSKSGIVSKRDGSFTFPIALKANDVLVFSYLGYVTKEVTIDNNSTYIEVTLEETPIDVLSELNTDKPYKSKRSKN